MNFKDYITIKEKHNKSFDYYKILGVSQDATNRDIKTAYHNLITKLHPDKNIDTQNNSEQFQQIIEAYKKIKEIRHIT